MSSFTKSSSDHSVTERFIIKFIGAFDIPSDYGSKSDPYVKAYISEHVVQFDQDNRKFFKLQRISNAVHTPKRLDCSSVIWNCYRDFKINPPMDSVLVIEIYNSTNDVSDDKLLGKVDIPVKVFVDEAPKIFNFVSTKSTSKQKNPNFSITLSRAFIENPPPLQKTFFVIRHGESKWNLAQSKINITGMLDRDHALTEEGIKQAEALNIKWRFEGSNDVAQQQQAVKTPKPKESPTAASGGGGIISFIDPEEEANFATADLLGDYDDSSNNNQNNTNNSNSDFNNTTAAVFGMNETAAADASILSTGTVPFVTPKKEKAFSLTDNDWSPFGNDSANLLAQPDPAGAGAVAQQQMTSDTAAPQDGIDVLSDLPVVPENGVVGQTTEEEEDGGGRESFCDDFDQPHDPNRSTSAIIDEFHKINLDFKNAGKCTSFHLHSTPPPAPPVPDRDEFFEQRRDEYINLFKHADRVYSSPLTRAIETAYVSMEGHPALAETGLTLYSIIREIKRIGGFDTVGIECGEGIKKRVRAELKAVLGKERTDALMSAAGSFSVGDADQPWWTPISSYENGEAQQERVREFISFVRHCDAKLPVFVGHSLFFKAFYSKRISTVLYANRPEISANLKKFRLSNASLLAVTVSFVEIDGLNEAVITDADLIFGGGFHGVSSHIVDEDEEDAKDGGANGVESSTSPPGNRFLDVAENFRDNIRDKFKNNLPHDLRSGKDALKKGIGILSSKLNDFFEK